MKGLQSPDEAFVLPSVFLELKAPAQSHTKFVIEQAPGVCFSALHSVFNKWHWGARDFKDKETYLHIFKQFCPRLQVFEVLWRSGGEMTLYRGRLFSIWFPRNASRDEEKLTLIGSLCNILGTLPCNFTSNGSFNPTRTLLSRCYYLYFANTAFEYQRV